jgi:hypothetical protein
LTEKLVLLENDANLQQKKALLLMEENKSVREENKNKEKLLR